MRTASIRRSALVASFVGCLSVLGCYELGEQSVAPYGTMTIRMNRVTGDACFLVVSEFDQRLLRQAGLEDQACE